MRYDGLRCVMRCVIKKIITKIFISIFLMTSILILLNVSFSSAARINAKKIELEKGLSRLMRVDRIKNTQKVKWSSKNKKIATVSKIGRVKGKKKGSTEVIAKVNGKKYICTVKVVPKMTDRQRVEKFIKQQEIIKRVNLDKYKLVWDKKGTKLLEIEVVSSEIEFLLYSDEYPMFEKTFEELDSYVDFSGYKDLKRVVFVCMETKEINVSGLKSLKSFEVYSENLKHIDFYGTKKIKNAVISCNEFKMNSSDALKNVENLTLFYEAANNINFYHFNKACKKSPILYRWRDELRMKSTKKAKTFA